MKYLKFDKQCPLKRVKGFILVAIIAFFMIILSSCNSQTISISTSLDIDSNFEGKRVMTCTFPFTVNSNAEQIEYVDKVISQGCPKELSYSKSIDDRRLSYVFVLEFSSVDEYSDKLKTITSGKSNIVFSNPDSIFTKGIFVKENFDSVSLLSWIEDTAKFLDYANLSKSKLSCTDTYISWNGIDYKTTSFIGFRQLKGFPIDNISIDTVNNGNKMFTRKISFKIPRSTMKELGGDIITYMNARSDKAVSKTWTDYPSGSIYEVTFNAASVKQLENFTNKILNSNNSGSIKYSDNYEISNLLNDEMMFEEVLDLSSYVGPQSRPVDLQYSYTISEDSKFNEVYTKAGSQKKSANYTKENTTVFREHSDAMFFNITDGGDYKLLYTEITLNCNGDANFTRDMAFVFNNQSSRAAEHIREVLNNIDANIDMTCEQLDNSFVCHLTSTGSAEEITNSFSSVFGQDNSFNYNVDDASAQLHQSTTMIDKMHLSDIYNEENRGSKIYYNILTNGFEQVNSIMTKSDDRNSNIKARTNDKGIIKFELNDSDITVTYNGEKPNFWGVVLYLVLIIIAVAAVICIIILINKGYFKRPPKDNKPPKKEKVKPTESEIHDILSDI